MSGLCPGWTAEAIANFYNKIFLHIVYNMKKYADLDVATPARK